MISGGFNDFHWQADIDEDELDHEEGPIAVDVTTPTGGKVAIVMYGPWEDLESFSDLVEEDVEYYTDMS